jgi:hypothetical protein
MNIQSPADSQTKSVAGFAAQRSANFTARFAQPCYLMHLDAPKLSRLERLKQGVVMPILLIQCTHYRM